MVKMQKQKGTSDCGVFTIKIATSLAFGINPTASVFEQDCMRGHLSKCLEAKKRLFPTVQTNN